MESSKFAYALGSYQGFCRGKSGFSLICVCKLLPRQTGLNNIFVNFWIKYCKNWNKKQKRPLSEQNPIIPIVNNKRKKMKEKTRKAQSMDKTLVGTEESAGRIIQKCSVNKVFWKITHNLLKNTSAGFSFWWDFRPRDCNFIKNLLHHRCFPVNFAWRFARTTIL